MRSIAQERLSYLVVRSLALVVQLGGLVCLTPIKQYGSYPERIAGFVSLFVDCLVPQPLFPAQRRI
jgi:hypothetical protein